MGKWDTNDEDVEDFEQEKLIAEWLKREGMSGAVDLQHINRKGHARNTLIKASISLDQQVGDESGSATFADLIAGSDGRDLEVGGDDCDPELEAQEQVSRYLLILGFNQGELEWLTKMLKLSIDPKLQRSLKSLTSLESWTQFEPFNT
jgi:hypothetical protein